MKNHVLHIGDIHGLDVWRTILYDGMEINDAFYNIDSFEEIVFHGDYVDSFDIKDGQIFENLLNLLELKKNHPDKVVILWGNHDVQYLFDGHVCSGYRPTMGTQLGVLYNDNREMFRLAHVANDNTLCTHAGVHRGWYEYRLKPWMDEHPEVAGENWTIADWLNFMFDNEVDCLFDVGRRRGGRHPVGGPLWCDSRILSGKAIPGWHQIVGHTRRNQIWTHIMGHATAVTYIDVLEDVSEPTEMFYIKEIDR